MDPASRQRRGVASASSAVHQPSMPPASGPQGGFQLPKLRWPGTSGAKLTSVTGPSLVKSGRSGGAIKDMKQQFDVNHNSGTLNFSIPIETSPGRAEFGPKLGLNYGSGSGNGLFGIGWKLNHNAISRKTSRGIPRYDNSDVFVLDDGTELVRELPADAQISSRVTVDGSVFVVDRFLPRFIDSNRRIERWTNASLDGEVYWAVISADNTTTIFGSDDRSRIVQKTATGQKLIFSWLPSKTFDSHGNSMEYSYKAEDRAGAEAQPAHLMPCETDRTGTDQTRAKYLKSIRYGNRVPNRDLKDWHRIIETDTDDWMFQVIFDYGEHDLACPTTKEIRPWPVRQDPFSSHVSGFEVRTYRLCRRILMFHHIPEELGRKDCLVASTEFVFDENPRLTVLSSVVSSGHRADGQAGYTTETRAPWEFRYSQLPDMRELQMQSVDNFNVQAFPGGLPPYRAEWLDLDGDGAPGLLLEDTLRQLHYQRNQSELELGARFSNLHMLLEQPAMVGSKRHFADVNRNGHLDMVCSDDKDAALGYYERSMGSWSPFRYFDQTLAAVGIDAKSEARQIDLTGDGFADIIYMNSDRSSVTWHQNMADVGYGPARSVPVQDPEFELSGSANINSIHLADMSGDGLADVVSVTGGSVRYWPNLGHGRFGSAVVMGNAPQLSVDNLFDEARIRLADVDGSGTTDIVYFPPAGGVQVFINESGNSWADAIEIPHFPQLDSLATVSLVDLFGNGTSCLCWTGPDATGVSSQSLLYIDLARGKKPYMLDRVSNGMGHTWEIHYVSSTTFQRQDEADGMPWQTTMSIPIQVVASICSEDAITKTRTTSRFRYHDGQYDGEEHEFAGFCAVEQWDAETFSTTSTSFTRPPVHQKLWFHSGHPEHTIDNPLPFSERNVSSLQVPFDITAFEGYRSLRGKLLQLEVYSDDGSALESLPYKVTQHSYRLQTKQLKLSNRHPVIRVMSLDSTECHYERSKDSPRIMYTAILANNDFAQPTKSVQIAYGYKQSSLKRARDRQAQGETVMIVDCNEYTTAIDHVGAFREPAQSLARKWRLVGMLVDTTSPAHLLRDIELALAQSPEYLESFKGDKKQHGIVKLEEHCTLYGREDLQGYLELGKVQLFSSTARTYTLAAAAKPTWQDSVRTHLPADSDWHNLPLGYVDLNNDGLNWKPGNELTFSFEGPHALEKARGSFLSPDMEVDPYGNRHMVVYDDKYLLPVAQIDPLENRTSFTYDYARLLPTCVVDTNNNSTHAIYDAFGAQTGIAESGKKGDYGACSIDERAALVTDAVLDAFIENPLAQAPELLGSLSTRHISDMRRYSRNAANGLLLPCFKATISRNELPEVATSSQTTSIAIEYLDSKGQVMQTAEVTTVSAKKSSSPSWCIHGASIKDNKGATVREFRPLLKSSHDFLPPTDLSHAATTYLLDPLGRPVVTLYPDRAWTKTVFDPWHKTVFDQGDNVLTSDASLDQDVGDYFSRLDRSLYYPSWYDSKRMSLLPSDRVLLSTVEQVSALHNTPAVTHFDALGREICVIEDVNGLERAQSVAYSPVGYKTAHCDGLGRVVESILQDVGGLYRTARSMDSGATYTVTDCLGRAILTWTDDGVVRKTQYDALGRLARVHVVQDRQPAILVQSNTYGEAVEDAASKNLRTRLVDTRDQSGISRQMCFDFRGHCTSHSRQMAAELEVDLDWSKEVALSEETFEWNEQFDCQGRKTASVGPKGDITQTRYNVWGLPCRVTWQASRTGAVDVIVDEIQYNAEQQPSRVDRGNSTQTVYTHDSQTGRLVKKLTTRQDGTKIQHTTYVHDCLGREIYARDDSQQSVFFKNKQVTPVRRYQYDGLGRLCRAFGREQVHARNGTTRSFVQVKVPNFKGSTSAVTEHELASYTEKYSYDLAGNILNVSHQPEGESNIRGWARDYSYEEPSLLEPTRRSNRLSRTGISGVEERYGYSDPRRAVTGCIESMPGFHSLKWDFDRRLKSSSRQVKKEGIPETTFYAYDGAGKRMRKTRHRASVADQTSTTRLAETLYVENLTVHRKYKGDGITIASETVSIKVNTGIGMLLVHNLRSPKRTMENLKSYQIDHGLELDEEGSLVSYEEYSPFGTTTYAASGRKIAAPSVYRYAAHERDKETGFYSMGHRYYVHWLGRWLSPDPLGTVDDLNCYAYVGNDPVTYFDPTGLSKDTKAEDSKPEKGTMDQIKAIATSNTGKLLIGFAAAVAYRAAGNKMKGHTKSAFNSVLSNVKRTQDDKRKAAYEIARYQEDQQERKSGEKSGINVDLMQEYKRQQQESDARYERNQLFGNAAIDYTTDLLTSNNFSTMHDFWASGKDLYGYLKSGELVEKSDALLEGPKSEEPLTDAAARDFAIAKVGGLLLVGYSMFKAADDMVEKGPEAKKEFGDATEEWKDVAEEWTKWYDERE